MSEDRLPGARLLALGLIAADLMLMLGIGSAILGWAPGALLAVAGLVVLSTIHLTIGVFGYRAVMRRPWPKVEPLSDDDDW